ncbi:MAG: TolC family outer membrane protein [Halorhodospira sp.]
MKRGNERPQLRLAPRVTGWTLAVLLALPTGTAIGQEETATGNERARPGQALKDVPVPIEDEEDGLAPAETAQREPEQDLRAIYQLALEADRGLAAARNRRRAADEGTDQAIAQFLPQINAAGGYEDQTTTYPDSNRPDRDTEGWDATLSLTQPIFRRGYFVDLERARSSLDRADIEFSLAEQELILTVTEAYFDVLLAQDELALVESELAAVESQLRRAERALEVGTGTQTDVDEARATYDQVRSERVAAINQLDVARETLRRITGEQPAELAGLSEDFQPEPVEPGETSHWVDLAQRYNLEVQLASAEEEIARHDIDASRAERWPQLELEGQYRYTDQDQQVGSGPDEYPQDTRSVGLQVSMPLFTGGAISSRVRQAEAERTAAFDELADQRRASALDARSAFLSLRSGRERIEALEQALVSARSNEASVRRGQEVGTRTTTDVLDAQSQRFQTKRDLAEARYDYLLNFVQLQAAVGMAVDEEVVREINQELQSIPRQQ